MKDTSATAPLRITAESQEGLGYDGSGHLVVKPVRELIQVDGWANVETGDSVMVPDNEGDVLMGGRNRQPQQSATTVRILIAADADRKDVLRILRKQLDWCERQDGILRTEDSECPL